MARRIGWYQTPHDQRIRIERAKARAKTEPEPDPLPPETTEERREAKRFYCSKAWVRVRDWKRQTNPLCERCYRKGRITAMSEVHHLKPRRSHPALALDSENLVSLCTTCHLQVEPRRGGGHF